MGYYGQQNAGDDMMLYCILDWLKNQKLKITVISEKCKNITGTYRVSTIQNVPLLGQWGWPKKLVNGSVIRLVAALVNCKGLIVGGGDLIRDDLGWKNLMYTLEKCILAILFKRKLIFVNMGIGIPETIYGRMLMKFVLRNVHLNVVRDKRSYQYCRRINTSNLFLEPDIVFTLPQKLLDIKMPLKGDSSRCFVVALRDKALRFRKNYLQENCFKNFSEALDIVIEKMDINCLFVPFQQNTFIDDNYIHNQIYSNIKQKSRCRICQWDQDFLITCSRIKNAQFVIGMRFHSLVLGLSYGKKCFAIAYDEKCYQLCETEKSITVFNENDFQKSHIMAHKIINGYNYDISHPKTETNWNRIHLH